MSAGQSWNLRVRACRIFLLWQIPIEKRISVSSSTQSSDLTPCRRVHYLVSSVLPGNTLQMNSRNRWKKNKTPLPPHSIVKVSQPGMNRLLWFFEMREYISGRSTVQSTISIPSWCHHRRIFRIMLPLDTLLDLAGACLELRR